MRNGVFISYSHKDKRYLDDLLVHLRPLERAGLVTKWSDRQIAASSRWLDEIRAALAAAKIAVMLVSPSFLSSEFLHKHELSPLLKEAEHGGMEILWIPICACSYEDTPLKNYQAAAPPNKPLAEMKAERGNAWATVCDTINKSLKPGATLGPIQAYERLAVTSENFDKIFHMWEKYWSTRDRAAHAFLVQYYMHLVRYNIEKICSGLPAEMSCNHLFGAGISGLIDSIACFSPDQSQDFASFCGPRIRGQIFDELRQLDWVSIIVRSRVNRFNTIRDELRKNLGRAPTDDELANRLRIFKADAIMMAAEARVAHRPIKDHRAEPVLKNRAQNLTERYKGLDRAATLFNSLLLRGSVQ
jgi:DNA-directed RNA polymerase specialized sigma subunit